MVADLQDLVASWDHGLAVAGDRSEQDLPVGVEQSSDVAQLASGESRPLADRCTEYHHRAPGHRVDLVGAGEVQQLEDLLGGVGIGVDHHVRPDRAQQRLPGGAAQLVVLDAYHRRGHAVLLGEQRGDQVHLVVLGHPGQHLGPFDARFDEHRRVAAAADHHLDVEVVADGGGRRGVGLDHHDVVVFRAEPLGEVPADFARSDDDDVHPGSLARGAEAACVHPDRTRPLVVAPLPALRRTTCELPAVDGRRIGGPRCHRWLTCRRHPADDGGVPPWVELREPSWSRDLMRGCSPLSGRSPGRRLRAHHRSRADPHRRLARISSYSKAGIPVIALPRMRVWISLVPS